MRILLNSVQAVGDIGSGSEGHLPAMEKKRGLEAAGGSGDGRPEPKRARPPALAR